MSYTVREFAISAESDRNQELPHVAARADGGFDVAWQDGSDFAEDITPRIQGASFSPNGNETQKPSTFGNEGWEQTEPDVTALANGNTVATWEARLETPGRYTPDALTAIHGEVRDPDGKVVNTFQIPGSGQDDQLEPAITALSSGGFAMAREGTAGDAEGVIFDANGEITARFTAKDEVGIVQSDVDLT